MKDDDVGCIYSIKCEIGNAILYASGNTETEITFTRELGEALLFDNLPAAKKWFDSLPDWPRWELFIGGYRVENESSGAMSMYDMEAVHAKFDRSLPRRNAPDVSSN